MVAFSRCVIGLGTLLSLSPVSAVKMLYDDSLPEDPNAAYSAALMADIACDPLVPALCRDFYYPPTTLTRVCTTACDSALQSWESSVRSACGNDIVIPDENDLDSSPIGIPASRRYTYSFTCLKENDVFYGPIAALASFFADPGAAVNTTCSVIATAANITEPQLLAWNPGINPVCSNLDMMNGTTLCIEPPGPKLPPAQTPGVPPVTPTSAAPILSNTAIGSDKPCGRWYEIEPGDYCNLLTLKFAISLEDFMFLSTSINSN
ncbi:uncharacterized protein GLRG_00923 [Colletotrichum graminicola M1.001]|uniref:LysM domain-containing protein n=1 Tax=Colletotrichum graminicola (strain M1.001 / M2 / FGSC 10212) TaxID=645133 RepID=E3Q512_COLGM|nr:uncharacterized protein GLRG_00923 [Colletotrichum graminicola M1.001]EFQ25779.1 hypothetical protein GLRG_00923 [Colletotrichum graminicola M1.001]